MCSLHCVPTDMPVRKDKYNKKIRKYYVEYEDECESQSEEEEEVSHQVCQARQNPKQ